MEETPSNRVEIKERIPLNSSLKGNSGREMFEDDS